MHFDEIVKRLGEFGRFQRRTYFLLCLIAIPDAWHAIGSVFLTATTDHWCKVPSVPGLNCTLLNLTESQCTEKKRNLTIPYKVTDSTVVYEQCRRYNDSIFEDNFYSVSADENSTEADRREIVRCGDGWEYDHSQYTSTAVTEFDLVCDKDALPNFAQSIFMAGILCGSVFFGTLSDWIGRFPVFFICAGLEAIIGTIAAFAPNFTTFTSLRFFVGMTNLGGYMSAFVLGTEFVGPQYRALAGTIILLYFSVGYMILAVLAYFIRDWRHLQIAISVPIIFFLVLIPFVSESARWLMSRGRYDKAEKIIRKAAKVNNKELPEVLFDENEKTAEKEAQLTGGRRPTQLDLFRTPNLRLKTINILYNWFVNNLVYYGLSLSTSGLGVNVYVAAFVSGAVEFPAYLSCWFIIQRFGRRVPLCLYMVIGGIACLLTIVIPLGVYRTIVAMVGKFCISASFGLVYIVSAEIYPTVVRSIGLGLSSMSARVSGVLSPLILLLGNYWAPLPLIVFGANSIIAGLLALFLPETLGTDLPQTLEDGEEIGRGGSGLPCFKKTDDGYKPTPDQDADGTQADNIKEQKV